MLPDDALDWEELDNGVRVRESCWKRPLLKVFVSFTPLQSTENTPQRCFQIPSRAASVNFNHLGEAGPTVSMF